MRKLFSQEFFFKYVILIIKDEFLKDKIIDFTLNLKINLLVNASIDA